MGAQRHMWKGLTPKKPEHGPRQGLAKTWNALVAKGDEKMPPTQRLLAAVMVGQIMRVFLEDVCHTPILPSVALLSDREEKLKAQEHFFVVKDDKGHIQNLSSLLRLRDENMRL